MDFFGKTKFVLQLDNRAVVEDALAGYVTENLVGYHTHNFEVEGFVTVNERMESAIETSVVGYEFPVFHIARLAFFVAGNDKLGAADFVGLAVVEEQLSNNISARARIYE